jgi:hypothetical protein
MRWDVKMARNHVMPHTGLDTERLWVQGLLATVRPLV